MPDDRIEHLDRRLGPLDQDVYAEVGDFVVRRSDQHWAYQLAVTVDDSLQGVTALVRGDDLAASTARQLLLRRLLYSDAPPLDTLHLPLLRDSNGQRIAKRTGGFTIAERRAAGERPEAVVGWLAASVGLVAPGTAITPSNLLPAWIAADSGASLTDRGIPFGPAI